MFREADVNNDGQLTFQEWFQWLGAVPSSALYSQANPLQATKTSSPDKNKSTAGAVSGSLAVDPMVEALSLVLSNAVCTLKITARITQDPSVLAGTKKQLTIHLL